MNMNKKEWLLPDVVELDMSLTLSGGEGSVEVTYNGSKYGFIHSFPFPFI